MSASLTIGIDARAADEELGGRGTVVRELLLALDALAPPHRFVLFGRSRWEAPLSPERFAWHLDPASDPWWHVRTAVRANRACDAFLSTNSYLTVWFLRVPSVMVVMDLVTFDASLLPQRRARMIERATLPWAVRRASTITAISAATANDLVVRFPTAARKTTVTPLAASPRFSTPPRREVVERVLAAHELDRPYVLVVGTLEPRKNLVRLVEAFGALNPAVRDAHDLVLVGARGWDLAATDATLARHAHLVRTLGHVADDELPALYAGAAAFAYPSLYEGFGLPVLEAMSAGAPVLTSNRSSLPEVAGDAALLVDPLDVRAIRDGLHRMLTDSALADRLRTDGMKRARRFSWAAYASQTLAAVEAAAGA